MRPPLDDSRILVTGASSGIGVALARQLAPSARVLVLVARRGDRLQDLATDLRTARPALTVEVESCDLADGAARAALVEAITARHGGLDILVNCAGLGDIALLEQSDPAKLELMLQVNVVALTMLTRAFLPGMVAQGRGGILNISSGFGLTWMPVVAAYAGSKHYVTAFSESLRAELAGSGVVVTQSCPGPVATEFEAVAGNPTGQKVPGFVELTADQCAHASLRAFRRGRALVVPGFVAAILIHLGASSPRPVLRLLYGLLGRLARPRLLSQDR